MTIALGILARNGVVIAADREETVGEVLKYEENKIRGTFHLSADAKNRHLLLAGAGWADHIDAFAEMLEDEGVLRDRRIEGSPKAVFDGALERFYARKIVPFSGYPPDERPHFRVVIGYVGAGRSHLFVSSYNVLKRVERFVVIGSGSLVAQPILLRLMTPNAGLRSVDVREAVVIAAHAIREAKEASPGVGKETDILAMFNDGTLARTVSPTQARLDAALQRYSSVVEPLLIRSMIGTREPSAVVAEIEKLKQAIQEALGDTFTVSPRVAEWMVVKNDRIVAGPFDTKRSASMGG